MRPQLIRVLLPIAAALSCFRCATPKPPVYPPLVLDLAGRESSAEVILHSVIVPGGPDAFTKEARWDEYVLTFTNRGGVGLSFVTVCIEDAVGNRQLPEGDLHKLTERTIENWKVYRKVRLTVSKESFESTVPSAAGVLLVGASAILNPAELIFLPIDSAGRSKRQTRLQQEVAQRQLVFPLLLQPGSSAMGSIFFPMTAGPCRLTVKVESEGRSFELVIPLTVLSQLHLVTAQ